ncbi:adenylyl-sulfate kinase [Nocardioides salsibiostraticola]
MSTPAVPQFCPSPRELEDLELLLSGALTPLTTFNEPDSVITLTLPEDLESASEIELVDPEGLPLALWHDDGQLTPLSAASHGPFRRLHLSPAQVREQYAGRTFIPVTDALTDTQLDQVLAVDGPIAFLALMGAGTPALSPVALLRATSEVAHHLGAAVVAVPLASHGEAETDHDLGVQVVNTYAHTDPVVALTDGGEILPELMDIVASDQPPADRRGLVLFFTGLSGSGKSTLAQALMDRLLEQGGRTVTSLDGDVVRRNLSAGLSFSKADRETNIRRIGWVAAEISRHGGVAVCSPIAPFEETRQQVRAMVDDAGGAFFLVHVATPLEECERRDRKGLYAKARAGEIPEFTGISSPYEEPDDADVHVDTTGRSIDEALADVIEALEESGYLSLTPPVATPPRRAAKPGNETPVAPAVASAPVEVRAQRASKPSDPQSNESAEAPLNILFVCTANICRSPYMELRARALATELGAADSLNFSGAGTHGFNEHPMDSTMAEALAQRDTTTEGFSSRPLTKALIAEADLVLTAEGSHRSFILDDHPGAFRKVFTLGQFAAAAEAATTSDSGISGRDLITSVGQRRGGADRSLDIADPYRRGPDAAETCATQIDELLRVVVPALVGSARITP